MRTLEQWQYLTRTAFRQMTDEQVNGVAKLCFDKERRGEKATIYDAIATYFGPNSFCAQNRKR